jgi:NADPH:quinone reductase-like Zn-dependent oxidoreductase
MPGADWSIPTTSKSLLHNPKTHTLTLVPDHPTPQPEKHQHLLRVHSTSLTSSELTWPEPASLAHPIPGFDVSGVVITTVPNSPFQAGAEVYALTSFSRPGAAAEYQVALPSELALKPLNLTFEEAASVPLSALTAWQLLFVHARLEAPVTVFEKDEKNDNKEVRREVESSSSTAKRILVTAASGGVGVWAVQLAKWSGAYVVGTCGTSKVEFVQALGADEVIDYKSTNLKGWMKSGLDRRKFDIVVDCVGGKTLEEAWLCVKENGFLGSVAQPALGKRPGIGVEDNVQTKWFIVEPDGQQLAKIADLLERGICRPIVDSTYNLDDYGEAFSKLNAGHVTGKIVLQVHKPA